MYDLSPKITNDSLNLCKLAKSNGKGLPPLGAHGSLRVFQPTNRSSPVATGGASVCLHPTRGPTRHPDDTWGDHRLSSLSLDLNPPRRRREKDRKGSLELPGIFHVGGFRKERSTCFFPIGITSLIYLFSSFFTGAEGTEWDDYRWRRPRGCQVPWVWRACWCSRCCCWHGWRDSSRDSLLW